jgi:hypothetical protein
MSNFNTLATAPDFLAQPPNLAMNSFKKLSLVKKARVKIHNVLKENYKLLELK